jgi:hypothetical protein
MAARTSQSRQSLQSLQSRLERLERQQRQQGQQGQQGLRQGLQQGLQQGRAQRRLELQVRCLALYLLWQRARSARSGWLQPGPSWLAAVQAAWAPLALGQDWEQR